jgi:hypothetical protein
MIGLKVDNVKRNFFDKREVIQAVGKAKAGVMSQGGALIMRIARNSMRAFPASKAKRISDLRGQISKTSDPAELERLWREIKSIQDSVSPAGSTPRFNPARLLKDFLFFAYDFAARAAVIGPAKLNGNHGAGVPRTLEEGGTETVRNRNQSSQIKIAPHPYMGPALSKAEPKLPGLWADSVKP